MSDYKIMQSFETLAPYLTTLVKTSQWRKHVYIKIQNKIHIQTNNNTNATKRYVLYN